MSRYSGKYSKGARAVQQEMKRNEATARNAQTPPNRRSTKTVAPSAFLKKILEKSLNP